MSSSSCTASVWKVVSTQTRRWLNLGSTFGSAVHAESVYDRVTGHPVFCVTTPWGSPYMNMEKLTDIDETVPVTTDTTKKTPSSLSEEQNEYRMVALYFMDPSDALAVHGEMKQMENMEKSDIRLTTFSLAKALRQASNLGHGLPTGMAPDPLSGKLQVDDGAALRYKIVPAKRQLYYAARCIGKERVGLFSESATEDAVTAVIGSSAIEAANLARRREKRERKTPKQAKNAMQAAASHMDGYSGVPVFYCERLHKQLPVLKQILSGTRHETPLFFNYEDLVSAWETMRQHSTKQRIPEKPVVEVFNLWDVLTSMDKDKYVRGDWKKDPVNALKRRLFLTKEPPTLQDVTFVPNSASVHYKDSISRRGNGKARLRPMR
jgi:Tic22-like family